MASVAKNILHVDDDPQITRIVAKKLEHFGFTVKSVNDPLAAMPCITQENFRVVLLDIEMPGKDGMQLLEEIKHHDGGVQEIGRASCRERV